MRKAQQCHRVLHSLGCASSLDEFDIDFSAQLGYGAFGAVYAGQHRQTNQDVAIKTMSPVFAPAECCSEPSDLQEGLLQERQVFEHILESGASHPHVVDLVSCFEGPGEEAHQLGLELPQDAVESTMHYFVMERLEGKSLQEHIEQSDGLDELEVKKITHAVCEGVSFLHQQGIVHRDLKPANVLYQHSHDSSAGAVKLIDFSHAGLAPVDVPVGAAVFDKKLGTAGYVAPEILLNEQPYNHNVTCSLLDARFMPCFAICAFLVDILALES